MILFVEKQMKRRDISLWSVLLQRSKAQLRSEVNDFVLDPNSTQ